MARSRTERRRYSSSAQSSLGSDRGDVCTATATRFPRSRRERFRTQLYRERIVYPEVWNKVVVDAREDDYETMLNHALKGPAAAPGVAQAFGGLLSVQVDAA
jgi:hypothetical protein